MPCRGRPGTARWPPPSYAGASTSTCSPRWRTLGPEDAAEGLDELVDRHFVQEESPGWFGFRHALIRDAVEANAPLATRRALHARVAEVARHRPELGGDAYRSAHHEAAGQHDDAVDAASAAAYRASTLSSHREALDLLHRAVRCVRAGDERRTDLLARRAVEAAATDDNAQAAADFEAARELLEAEGDPVAAAALLPGLVAVRHLLGDPLPTRVALLDGGLAEVDGRDGDAAGSAPTCWPARRRRTSSPTGSTPRSRWPRTPSRRPAPRRSRPGSTPRSPSGRSRCSPAGSTTAGRGSRRPPGGPVSSGSRRRRPAATG